MENKEQAEARTAELYLKLEKACEKDPLLNKKRECVILAMQIMAGNVPYLFYPLLPCVDPMGKNKEELFWQFDSLRQCFGEDKQKVASMKREAAGSIMVYLAHWSELEGGNEREKLMKLIDRLYPENE